MPGSTVAQAHVLVVDDAPTIRSLVSIILESEGYHVTTAANGKEALERIAIDPPDLVLLDLVMPVMSGWELQEALRARSCTIPVVLMSADQRARAEAARHGAGGCLPKPFDPDVLLQTVARFVGS